MNILLVVTNTRGKSLGFLTDSLKALKLKEAVDLANKGDLKDVFPVEGKFGAYLHSFANASNTDNVDTKSITAADIIAYANRTRHFQSTDAISVYVAEHYKRPLYPTGNYWHAISPGVWESTSESEVGRTRRTNS